MSLHAQRRPGRGLARLNARICRHVPTGRTGRISSPNPGILSGMDLTLNAAVLVVLGLVAVNAGVVLLVGALEAPSWIRDRRARRIEESFGSGRFTVPTSWVREARQHRSAAGR